MMFKLYVSVPWTEEEYEQMPDMATVLKRIRKQMTIEDWEVVRD